MKTKFMIVFLLVSLLSACGAPSTEELGIETWNNTQELAGVSVSASEGLTYVENDHFLTYEESIDGKDVDAHTYISVSTMEPLRGDKVIVYFMVEETTENAVYVGSPSCSPSVANSNIQIVNSPEEQEIGPFEGETKIRINCILKDGQQLKVEFTISPKSPVALTQTEQYMATDTLTPTATLDPSAPTLTSTLFPTYTSECFGFGFDVHGATKSTTCTADEFRVDWDGGNKVIRFVSYTSEARPAVIVQSIGQLVATKSDCRDARGELLTDGIVSPVVHSNGGILSVFCSGIAIDVHFPPEPTPTATATLVPTTPVVLSTESMLTAGAVCNGMSPRQTVTYQYRSAENTTPVSGGCGDFQVGLNDSSYQPAEFSGDGINYLMAVYFVQVQTTYNMQFLVVNRLNTEEDFICVVNGTQYDANGGTIQDVDVTQQINVVCTNGAVNLIAVPQIRYP